MAEYEAVWMFMEQTKITDVNLDCLEYLLNYLDLDDLLNVAQSNKYLKTAVDLTFSSRYSKKLVRIGAGGEILYKKRFQQIDDNLLIGDEKTSFEMIRLFGHRISRLEIVRNSYLCKNFRHLIGHMNQYCANSLIELTIQGVESESWLSFNRPFNNVKKLTIELKNSCNWTQNYLKRFFPNVISLKILNFSTWTTNFKCIENNFAKLEHLEIGEKGVTAAKIRKENLYYALRLNPQLKSFKLHCDFDGKFFHNVEDLLQNLDDLMMTSEHEEFYGYDNLAELFKNVEKIDRYCNCPLKNIPIDGRRDREKQSTRSDEHKYSMLSNYSDPFIFSTRF